MKVSQATASREVINSDKASILDLACAILHYLAKPNFPLCPVEEVKLVFMAGNYYFV